MNQNISRRSFLKKSGLTLAAAGIGLDSMKAVRPALGLPDEDNSQGPQGKMEFRTDPLTGQQVSLLGYGCMRWPSTRGKGVDQEEVNRLVDYAMEHGVNYFDTAPAYGGGLNEAITGNALRRHPRESYLIATKLSNFSQNTWSREASMAMYQNSFKQLGVDYIDYYLLHSLGDDRGGKQKFEDRFVKNGMVDFLMEERRKGKIRHLGFSFHGAKESFDHAMSLHEKYHWDFVQIQMNYVDWNHAVQQNSRNTDASYLYGELAKRDIPVVVMEPLLGSRLSKVSQYMSTLFKEQDPERSVASWAFRFAGTFPKVLTVLSGMTYMEHLEDNLKTFCSFQPLNQQQLDMLEEFASLFLRYPTIPCTACNYCMPCPYGIDIPAVFQHYNKCVNEGNVPATSQDSNYRAARRAFLVGYDRSVNPFSQADHCIGCGQCRSLCPQRIDIPAQMQRIDRFVEELKQGKSF